MPEHADLLAGLHGLRVPEPGLADLLVPLGLGLLIGWAALLLLRPRRPRGLTVSEQIAALDALPEAERLTALAHLLKRQTEPTKPPATPWADRARRLGIPPGMLLRLRRVLYASADPAEIAELEAALRRAARRTEV
ncbi:MAG: hypothetical protein AAFU49_21300 [Pseudomonadota bacterium]